ncbi:hypothetical protein RJ55_04405 [Drechmeria coniospora]|nr:hypothetical protein RJ55_04405 [Drechmeria coniospora]
MQGGCCLGGCGRDGSLVATSHLRRGPKGEQGADDGWDTTDEAQCGHGIGAATCIDGRRRGRRVGSALPYLKGGPRMTAIAAETSRIGQVDGRGRLLKWPPVYPSTWTRPLTSGPCPTGLVWGTDGVASVSVSVVLLIHPSASSTEQRGRATWASNVGGCTETTCTPVRERCLHAHQDGWTFAHLFLLVTRFSTFASRRVPASGSQKTRNVREPRYRVRHLTSRCVGTVTIRFANFPPIVTTGRRTLSLALAPSPPWTHVIRDAVLNDNALRSAIPPSASPKPLPSRHRSGGGGVCEESPVTHASLQVHCNTLGALYLYMREDMFGTSSGTCTERALCTYVLGPAALHRLIVSSVPSLRASVDLKGRYVLAAPAGTQSDTGGRSFLGGAAKYPWPSIEPSMQAMRLYFLHRLCQKDLLHLFVRAANDNGILFPPRRSSAHLDAHPPSSTILHPLPPSPVLVHRYHLYPPPSAFLPIRQDDALPAPPWSDGGSEAIERWTVQSNGESVCSMHVAGPLMPPSPRSLHDEKKKLFTTLPPLRRRPPLFFVDRIQPRARNAMVTVAPPMRGLRRRPPLFFVDRIQPRAQNAMVTVSPPMRGPRLLLRRMQSRRWRAWQFGHMAPALELGRRRRRRGGPPRPLDGRGLASAAAAAAARDISVLPSAAGATCHPAQRPRHAFGTPVGAGLGRRWLVRGRQTADDVAFRVGGLGRQHHVHVGPAVSAVLRQRFRHHLLVLVRHRHDDLVLSLALRVSLPRLRLRFALLPAPAEQKDDDESDDDDKGDGAGNDAGHGGRGEATLVNLPRLPGLPGLRGGGRFGHGQRKVLENLLRVGLVPCVDGRQRCRWPRGGHGRLGRRVHGRDAGTGGRDEHRRGHRRRLRRVALVHGAAHARRAAAVARRGRAEVLARRAAPPGFARSVIILVATTARKTGGLLTSVHGGAGKPAELGAAARRPPRLGEAAVPTAVVAVWTAIPSEAAGTRLHARAADAAVVVPPADGGRLVSTLAWVLICTLMPVLNPLRARVGVWISMGKCRGKWWRLPSPHVASVLSLNGRRDSRHGGGVEDGRPQPTCFGCYQGQPSTSSRALSAEVERWNGGERLAANVCPSRTFAGLCRRAEQVPWWLVSSTSPSRR